MPKCLKLAPASEHNWQTLLWCWCTNSAPKNVRKATRTTDKLLWWRTKALYTFTCSKSELWLQSISDRTNPETISAGRKVETTDNCYTGKQTPSKHLLSKVSTSTSGNLWQTMSWCCCTTLKPINIRKEANKCFRLITS